MMVKFINKISGGFMWVAENRVNEYKAAGHRLAASPVTTKKPENAEPVKIEPAKKKVTRKK